MNIKWKVLKWHFTFCKFPWYHLNIGVNKKYVSFPRCSSQSYNYQFRKINISHKIIISFYFKKKLTCVNGNYHCTYKSKCVFYFFNIIFVSIRNLEKSISYIFLTKWKHLLGFLLLECRYSTYVFLFFSLTNFSAS